MSNDTYDDGLVHSHGWATEPVRPGLGREQPASHAAATEESPFDDGLVHNHAWASAGSSALRPMSWRRVAVAGSTAS